MYLYLCVAELKLVVSQFFFYSNTFTCVLLILRFNCFKRKDKSCLIQEFCCHLILLFMLYHKFLNGKHTWTADRPVKDKDSVFRKPHG